MEPLFGIIKTALIAADEIANGPQRFCRNQDRQKERWQQDFGLTLVSGSGSCSYSGNPRIYPALLFCVNPFCNLMDQEVLAFMERWKEEQ
jgi:hypothetical protein